ncbi:MAG: protein kinase domain-containing protein [Chromatiales bacterium]
MSLPTLAVGTTQHHRYVIESVLGQGNVGVTYGVLDMHDGTTLALKEYFPRAHAGRQLDDSVRPVSDVDAREFALGFTHFMEVAGVLQTIDHPNIVRVLDVFEANGTAYVVMRYETGETFEARLARGDPLREAELLRIAVALLDGLEEVHAAGVIHRDIKEAHIVMRADGSPVLLDFGATRVAMLRRRLMMTQSDSGDPLRRRELASDSGPWTDIHALAAMLYRVAMGKGARRSNGVSGMPSVSPEVLTAIQGALTVQPQERPQSVREWRAELEAALRSLPVEAVAAPASATISHASLLRADSRSAHAHQRIDEPSPAFSATLAAGPSIAEELTESLDVVGVAGPAYENNRVAAAELSSAGPVCEEDIVAEAGLSVAGPADGDNTATCAALSMARNDPATVASLPVARCAQQNDAVADRGNWPVAAERVCDNASATIMLYRGRSRQPPARPVEQPSFRSSLRGLLGKAAEELLSLRGPLQGLLKKATEGTLSLLSSLQGLRKRATQRVLSTRAPSQDLLKKATAGLLSLRRSLQDLLARPARQRSSAAALNEPAAGGDGPVTFGSRGVVVSVHEDDAPTVVTQPVEGIDSAGGSATVILSPDAAASEGYTQVVVPLTSSGSEPRWWRHAASAAAAACLCIAAAGLGVMIARPPPLTTGIDADRTLAAISEAGQRAPLPTSSPPNDTDEVAQRLASASGEVVAGSNPDARDAALAFSGSTSDAVGGAPVTAPMEVAAAPSGAGSLSGTEIATVQTGSVAEALAAETPPAEGSLSGTEASVAHAEPVAEAWAADSHAAEEHLSGMEIPAVRPESTAAADVATLLAGAAADVDAFRLITPKGNSALEKYQRVLQVDPENQAARDGMRTISWRYVDLAHGAMKRGQLDEAGRYLDRAEWVAPGGQAVAKARTELDARRRPSAAGETLIAHRAGDLPGPSGRQATVVTDGVSDLPADSGGEATSVKEGRGPLIKRLEEILERGAVAAGLPLVSPPKSDSRGEEIRERWGVSTQ